MKTLTMPKFFNSIFCDFDTSYKCFFDDVNLAFDLFFKNFDVGMAVNGICHPRGHLCFTNTSCFLISMYFYSIAIISFGEELSPLFEQT